MAQFKPLKNKNMNFLTKIVEKKRLSITEMSKAVNMPISTFYNKMNPKMGNQNFTKAEIVKLKEKVNILLLESRNEIDQLLLLTMSKAQVIKSIKTEIKERFEPFIADDYSEIYILDIAYKNDTTIIASIFIYDDFVVLHSRIENKKIRSFRFDELELINDYLNEMI